MSQSTDDSQPNNLLMFRAAIANGFQDIAKSVSKEEFLKIFTILESEQSVVKKLHKVMENDLFKALDQDLETLVTDECMVDGMKKLAKLNDETTVPPNVKLWRPPGDVNLHLRSLDAEKIKNECKHLESYICNVEKENQELTKIVTNKRESVQNVSDHMKRLLNMPFKLSELENTVKFNQECTEKLYSDAL